MPDDQSSEFDARASHVTPLPHESNAHRRAALVQNFPLFLNLSPEECRKIVLAARQENYERRQTIYLEGDPVNQIVFLTSGCAKVSQIGQNGSGDDAANIGQHKRAATEREAGEQVEGAQQQRQAGDADGPETHPLLHRRPRGTKSVGQR